MKQSKLKFFFKNGPSFKAESFDSFNPNSVEVAFIGRSNVGKSTLLNALFSTGKNDKNKAFTGKKPGKTQAAQFFGYAHKPQWSSRPSLPEYEFVAVDLPGYGFAKTSSEQILSMESIISEYITTRSKLSLFGRLFVLIDSRLGLQQLDLEMISWLDALGCSYQIVLTKLDKITEEELENIVSKILEELEKAEHSACYPQLFCVSSAKKLGINSLRQEIIRIVFENSSERVKKLLQKNK
eukprot:snap_masked-scaffold_3-processed-gene-7.21-mRNA-1 protein AED:0.08 eAED:0.08 QI:0/0/0/0.5/1/1/2/0/238